MRPYSVSLKPETIKALEGMAYIAGIPTAQLARQILEETTETAQPRELLKPMDPFVLVPTPTA